MVKNKKFAAYGLFIIWGLLTLVAPFGYLTSDIDNAMAALETQDKKAEIIKTENNEEKEDVLETETATKKEEEKNHKTLTMVATAYTADPAENGPWGAVAYDGQPLRRGIVAVDPNIIPMGSRLYIEGYGEAIAADQGGKIKGNRIDLFMDSKAEAYNWGMRTVKVIILD